MDNNTNPANSGAGNTSGNGIRLSGTPTLAPTHTDLPPSNETSFAGTGDNSSSSIRLFGVNVPVPVPSPQVTESYQSMSGQTISETVPVSNGPDLQASSPAPVLPQEVALNEDVNAPENGNGGEHLTVNNEGELLVDAVIHSPGGHQFIFYGLTLQEFANFQSMIMMIAGNIISGPLTPTQITQAITSISYNGTQANQDRCSICLEDFQHGGELASLPCHHTFHTTCITQWLSIRNSCPNCNAEPHDFDW